MPPPRIPFLRPPPHLRILRSSFQLPTLLRSSMLRARTPSPTNGSKNKPTPLPTLLIRLLKIFLTIHLTYKYLISLHPTTGISMVPLIPHSYRIIPPYILTSALHRRGRNIVVGDIITYVHPMMPNSSGCKRVIGMPGDLICVVTPGKQEGDDVEGSVEGVAEVSREEMIRVPEGHCWVAGDNLEWSRDSRVFGAVPLNLVRGKVLAVVWPPGEWRWFRSGVVDRMESGGDGEEREWVVTK